MKRTDLTGYRTIISLAISLVLKGLALRGVIAADGSSSTNVDLATDIVLMMASGVMDLAAMYFKLHAPGPGVLTPQGKAYREMVVAGTPRPKFDPAIEAAIKALEKAKEPPEYNGDSQCPIREVYSAEASERGELEKNPAPPNGSVN